MNSAICFICGIDGDLRHISLLEKSLFCAGIKIDLKQSTSTHICKKCEIDLDISYRLREQDEESEIKWPQEEESDISLLLVADDSFIDDGEEFIEEKKFVANIKIEETQDVKYESTNSSLAQSLETNEVLNDIEDDVQEFLSEKDGKEDNKIARKKRKRNAKTLRYKCDTCDMQFIYIHELREHQKEHGVNGYLNYCKARNKWFRERYLFKKHMQTHVRKMFKCIQCDCSYRLKRLLAHHIRTNHSQSLTQNPHPQYHAQFQPRPMVLPATISTSHIVNSIYSPPKQDDSQSKALVCEICNESFNCIDILKKHILWHPYSTEFICDVCGEIFKARMFLDFHMNNFQHFKHNINCSNKKQHEKSKNLTCEFCGDIFSNIGALKTHMWGEKYSREFICNKCGETFNMQSNLNDHMNVHASKKEADRGKALFRCGYCGESFQYRCRQRAHLRVHINKPPFQCNVCLHSCHYQANLNSHIVRHRKRIYKYHCEVCNRGNGTRNDHRAHQLLEKHSGDHTYKCATCKKAYEHLFLLRQHVICVHGFDIFLRDIPDYEHLDRDKEEKAVAKETPQNEVKIISRKIVKILNNSNESQLELYQVHNPSNTVGTEEETVITIEHRDVQ